MKLISYLALACLSLYYLSSCSSSQEGKEGDVHFKLGNFEAAVAAYTVRLKNDPNNLDLYFSRGRAYQEQDKFSEAQSDFEKALDLEPTNSQVLLSLAAVQLVQKSYASALLYASRAEEIPGAPAMASLLKGKALHQLILPEEALKAYGVAIQLDKNFGQAYFNRAILLLALDRKKQACEDFRRAAALEYPDAKEQLVANCS